MLPLFCFCSTQKTENQSKTKKTPTVKVIQPEKVNLAQTIHATGKLEATKQIKLGFKTPGIISDLDVKEGQKVKKGAILAKLDITEISSKRTQAVEQLSKAERNLKRVENLYKDSVATLEQLQDSRTAHELALMQLKVADFNLSRSQIIAPESGVILAVLAEEQEMIAAGHPVVYFGATNSHYQVNCQVIDKHIHKIKIGDSVHLSFDAIPGKVLKGHVESRGAMADPYSGTFSIQIAVSKTNTQLFSGMFTSVDIHTSAAKVCFKIPLDAIKKSVDNKAKIAIVTPEGFAIKSVEVLQLNNHHAKVIGEISEDDRLITMGFNKLKKGEKFNIEQ